jgi:multidrug efflux pump subunit AcrB
MPATTGYETTKEHVENISNIAGELSKEYVDPVTGESYFKYFVAVAGLSFGPAGPSFGTNYGTIIMEFEQGPSGYPEGFSIKKVQDQMRERIGDIPGAEKLSLSSSFNDFGKPLSVAIYGNDIERIDGLVGQIREYLKSYPGVFDIQDNFTSGKEEIKMSLTPLANALGLPQTEIASQVRDAVFGFEAQRIQRGTDEIKVMVRYPLVDRSSVSDLAGIKIRTPNSRDTIPLSELATLSSATSPTSIYRDRLRRAVTVSADIDSTNYDVAAIRTDLRLFMDELFASEAELSFNMDGQAETQKETAESFLLGFILVIIVIYALLAIPFKSFGQPLVVMSIIPLAIVGAIVGHYIMGLAFSMLSIMGILGLTGIVVNDSLVLVDYINQQRAKGMDVMEAVLTAGETRFRPVMLTSLTTFVGLLPLMLNQSTQAQSLIPMAVSLGFGIIFATLITLVITPINYLAGRHVKHSVISGARWLSQAWLRYWHKEDTNPSR